MGLIELFSKKSAERWELEKEFMRERHEQKLELERRKTELRLSVDEKKAELDKKMLDYQIKEAEAKIGEDFSDYPDEEEQEEMIKENPEDALLMQLATPILQSLRNSPKTPTGGNDLPPKQASSQPVGVTFTDEELEEIYNALPKAYKIAARGMSDENIMSLIRNKYPNITDECLMRACARVKR